VLRSRNSSCSHACCILIIRLLKTNLVVCPVLTPDGSAEVVENTLNTVSKSASNFNPKGCTLWLIVCPMSWLQVSTKVAAADYRYACFMSFMTCASCWPYKRKTK
jgi:hypothetical protein